MSWKIKRVLRTNAEYGWPTQKGYEVEIETTLDNGHTHIHNRFLSPEEFILRMFLEEQYTQTVVNALWKLIEDYGQARYIEGYNDNDTE